jgi:hypothetical protein
MKSITIAFLLIIATSATAQDQQRELFDLINEYRTDVLGINPVLYNATGQHECDERVVEIRKEFTAQVSKGIAETIMSTKYYDAILEKTIAKNSCHLQTDAESVCIGIEQKGKTIYCVIKVWLKAPSSIGL